MNLLKRLIHFFDWRFFFSLALAGSVALIGFALVGQQNTLAARDQSIRGLVQKLNTSEADTKQARIQAQSDRDALLRKQDDLAKQLAQSEADAQAYREKTAAERARLLDQQAQLLKLYQDLLKKTS